MDFKHLTSTNPFTVAQAADDALAGLASLSALVAKHIPEAAPFVPVVQNGAVLLKDGVDAATKTAADAAAGNATALPADVVNGLQAIGTQFAALLASLKAA
jgi:hypothetical protein